MSLSSTSALKAQLLKALGPSAQLYFDALANFVTGKSSRQEFEDVTKQVLTTPHLLQLHNALIISLFDATATLKRPPTPPPPTLPKPPPQKRRRTLLPYQGPDVSDEARSIRGQKLKRWALSVGKRERERVKAIEPAPSSDPPLPRRETDEIARERGIELISERGDPPGSRLPIHLHASTRAPTLQHVTDRVNLICAQNGLQNPARNVPSLVALACEAKLKQLITHALTLTSTSHAISSIAPALPSSSSGLPAHLTAHSHGGRPPVLTPDSFHTLFTISPADLPHGSAAAMRFAMGPSAIDQAFDAGDPLSTLLQQKEKELEILREKKRQIEKDTAQEKEKGKEAAMKSEDGMYVDKDPAQQAASVVGTPLDQRPPEPPVVDSAAELRDDPKWQIMALLAHRSTVRDGIRGTLNGAMRGGKIGLGMGMNIGMGKGR